MRERARSTFLTKMELPRFVIGAAEAESMAKEAGLTSLVQLLPTLVASAQNLARPPISNYHVGAVGLSSDGRIFLGVNLEFPNLPLHHSVHAEQFLFNNAAANSAPDLRFLAVSSAPCGHCRQFLQEIRNSTDLQLLITDNQNDSNFKPLSQFIPHPFGPNDLLHKDTPLLLEPHDNGLILDFNLSNGYTRDNPNLENSALQAANGSHAPYSGCPSGVALMDCEGKIYRGSYMESAAYNPSLGPLQAAVVAYVAGGGGGYEKIVEAVLVEKTGAKVRQEDTTRLLLRLISPQCAFRVVHCGCPSSVCRKASNLCE